MTPTDNLHVAFAEQPTKPPRTIDELERRAATVDAATRRAHELRDRMLDELVSAAWRRIGDAVSRLVDHGVPAPRALRIHWER